ncbi:MAG: chromate efflux transporter [Thermomicrobiales bacterium]
MESPQPQSGALRSVSRLGLKLGFTAFGGPAAHIAMLRAEVVDRREWLTGQRFLDLLGVVNLIPGPNSTEMVMHVGAERAGGKGLVAAGVCFILPAAAITLVFAWLYVEYGAMPGAGALLYGVKPVIIAVVAQALWGLARTAFKTWLAVLTGVAVAALALLGVNEIALLFGGALLFLGLRLAATRGRPRGAAGLSLVPMKLAGLSFLGVAAGEATIQYTSARLFLTFLKIGSVLYGSGYVLLAFLRDDFVVRYGWLTDRQLLDAVGVGQVTPGPVFTTATFVGYLVGGFPGAILATIGIFLPAFLFVGLTHRWVKELRRNAALGGLLDGVIVAALGLMAAVALTLARDAIVDVTTLLLALAAGILLVRFRVNATGVIALGAATGLARHLLG